MTMVCYIVNVKFDPYRVVICTDLQITTGFIHGYLLVCPNWGSEIFNVGCIRTTDVNKAFDFPGLLNRTYLNTASL